MWWRETRMQPMQSTQGHVRLQAVSKLSVALESLDIDYMEVLRPCHIRRNSNLALQSLREL